MRLARAHHPQLTGLQGILYKNFEEEENGLLVKVVVDVDLPSFQGCWVSCFQVGHQHRLLRLQRLHHGQEPPVCYLCHCQDYVDYLLIYDLQLHYC